MSAAVNSEVIVTFDDQQKINRFARLNAKCDELKEELRLRDKQLSNIEEALQEIDVLSLEGDEQTIRVLEGEVFVAFDLDSGQRWVCERKHKVSEEHRALSEQLNRVKDEMNELKVALARRELRKTVSSVGFEPTPTFADRR
ncbi:prefoldin-like protein [Dinothrombium tinctorium]|uniref:Prefoldin-like protein n=1 Tax=Dinothrombium tinctorium TaxID=1965070 RepID=A0A3S3NX94_9ACAR|nr:prefoldin-like protein [Dinothrombium tinctorium]RWS10902.1 prefoldin-like protein [Dinothrombium tinctorium]RWS10907.1 prefoldin-like protein [Dinothrombium tinctorium]